MIRVTISSVALILGLLLLTSGCLSQPHPRKNIFSLGLSAEDSPARSTPKSRTLLAATVTAAAGFDNRGLVFRVGPDQLETDFYNEFAAPPARLLADQAAQYLDAHNSRLRVVKSPGLVLADYGLETYLESLYGDFTVEPPEAVLNIRFTVSDLRPASPRPVLDQTYRQKRPLAAKTPAALVTALQQALGDLLAEFNRDLEKRVR
ncbi:MAG: PqiC family protein [Candidatus Adiutrix sp.]|jgi:cholesterol transport system auxiliary component|nr:PqiC family protein [Candidatus Adiutrix sp.]